jgi:CBS domain containing-hemolysin-like protein
MLLVAVAAGSALRNFRWPRLERLVGGEKNLERYERALKRERSILDGLLVTRIIASTVLVLLLLGEPLGEPQGLNFAGFSARLGLALGVLLLLVHGVVRGISRAIPERCLVLLLPVAEGVSHLMSPVVWLMDGLGNVMSRALGLERRDSEQEEAREDILDAVSEGERDGAIDDGAREMIENIMEVRDLAVTQVMTPRTSVFTISIDTPPSQALSLVAKRGHSRVPVVGESIDDVKGILYAKDMLQYFAEGKNELPPVREMMRTALFIPETKRTSELLQELKDAKVHLAVVVDEYGGMAGIITVEDIIEEIVGEIEDEYDRADQPESQSIKLLGEREAEVPANVFIDDLNEALNVDIPEGEDYDTVAGFLFSQMGRVPAAGERCAFDNVEFEIVSADERRIHTVRVTVAEAP